MKSHDFSAVSLSPELLNNLETMGYHQMTPVQAESLPLILDGKDVIAQAKTGSGKTAAFALGLLHNLEVKLFRIQSLVLCPTRELADQVAKEIRQLARAMHNVKVLTLCGGMPMGPQIGSLEHGAHIIVGTPGRIEDHLSKGRINLEHLNTLVLDEADRMLEMGFQSALDLIFEHCPPKRQTLLFSATFPDQIAAMTRHIMRDPARVKVESTHTSQVINQHYYQLSSEQQRMSALQLLLLAHNPESAVVFCNTKAETQQVADSLSQQGFSTLALHGDLDQKDRDKTLVRFSNKSVSVLVATDVAARGLDIDNLDAVINYHMSHDPEVHVHRIGRTGRAGSKGIACSLVSDRDVHRMIRLEDYLKQSFETEPLPSNDVLNNSPSQPRMTTLQIDGGKKQKVRPGDILGALTGSSNGDDSISGELIGKINIYDNCAFVAVNRKIAQAAVNKITQGKIKGRSFKVRHIRG